MNTPVSKLGPNGTLVKINYVFIYYILNWLSKTLNILDKLSKIWVEFINNENIITNLRIRILSPFFTFFKIKKATDLKNYMVKIIKILHTSQ